MKLERLILLVSILTLATRAQASQDDELLKHAHELGYATGEYQKTALYCNYFGIFSDAEYFAYRKIIVSLKTQLVGAKDAFLFSDTLEKQFRESVKNTPLTIEDILPANLTAAHMRTGCDALMTDWDHKIGVLRAKLDLFD